MALRQTLRVAAGAAQEGGLVSTLGRWVRDASGYRRYGLLAEDLVMEELPGVKEALSRLPQEEIDQRYYRLKRAMQLSMKKQELPKEQWITDETDRKYLAPVLAQVEKELKEASEYDHRA